MQHKESYLKKGEDLSYDLGYVYGPEPMFEVWKTSYSLKWIVSIYHTKLQHTIDSFYNASYYYTYFSSADEAKQYVDNFIEKYNKLKVFL